MAEKFLVAEDNEKNMRLIRLLMKKYGPHELIEASDGEEALKKALTEKPDVILMDIQLPKLSGMEVTKRLKEKEEFKHIPIIALTAHAMKGDKENFLNSGFDGYISKPINTRTFTEEIKNILKGE